MQPTYRGNGTPERTGSLSPFSFGAHTTPMPDDVDLSLPALVTTLVESLTELGLHQVTVVCNDPSL